MPFKIEQGKPHNVAMLRIAPRLFFLAFATTPFLVAIAQQTGAKPAPTAEQVFKDVKVFKGVPASDMIPAMQFMSASMNYSCGDCHDPNDYAANTNKNKDVTRKMILMQREINDKNFEGRLEVTCMTCHSKQEHPEGMPLPSGVTRRHTRLTAAPKPQELIEKHIKAAGTQTGMLVRKGTLTAPNDATAKVETLPLELIQAPDGKFRFISGDRQIGSDGKQTWYSGAPLADEPAAIFNRIGRSWRGAGDFRGLARPAVTGKDKVGATEAVVVQGFRASTTSAEELYFDPKTNLIVRLVNFRRSTLGTVVSAIDYSDFRLADGVRTPMKVVVTFAEGQKWVMSFTSAKLEPSVKESVFKGGG